MAVDAKITDLTAIGTIDMANDVMPVVDVSADITNKLTIAQLQAAILAGTQMPIGQAHAAGDAVALWNGRLIKAANYKQDISGGDYSQPELFSNVIYTSGSDTALLTAGSPTGKFVTVSMNQSGQGEIGRAHV